jgi:flagellar hook-associated protein 2
MAGTINSLGIGSGVLTADVIDKLKENEKSYTIDPITKKIELNKQKQDSLDLLDSLLTTLKGSTSSLSDDTLFSKRSVNGDNEEVSLSVNDGVDVQNINISDVSLAKESVQQSATFASEDSLVANGEGSLNLNIDGKNYTIEYENSTTLTELKDKINEVAGDDVTASILQVGDSEYSLVVKSDATGTNQDITITDNSGLADSKLLNRVLKSDSFTSSTDKIATNSGTMTIDIDGVTSNISYDSNMSLQSLADAINNDETLKDVVVASIVKEGDDNYRLVLNPIGEKDGADISITDNDGNLDTKLVKNATDMSAGEINEVQTAKDATFTYNGIELTRSTNEIDDIVAGMTLTLLKDGGSANLQIVQDRKAIKDELQNFVNSYNSMVEQLDKMTLADKEEGKVGIFSGDSAIRNMGREITKLIMSYDDNGNALSQYGVELNENGKLSFNASNFDKKMDEDPKGTQLFFTGKTEINKYDEAIVTDGIFDKINDQLKSYTKYNGTLDVLSQGLDKEEKSLQENYDRSLKLLNQRYDTMTQQFIEYDAIISQLNAQFSSLQMQIDQMIRSK